MPVAEAVDHKVVSHKEWAMARTELLRREKAFTHAREAMAETLRELPWHDQYGDKPAAKSCCHNEAHA